MSAVFLALTFIFVLQKAKLCATINLQEKTVLEIFMKYNFSNNEGKKDFKYAYSIIYGVCREFVETSDHLVNRGDVERGRYDYVSIVHNEKFTKGAKATLVSSFDSYGAPLITIANSVTLDEHGELRYGDHYEVVGYESGCNVWFITDPDEGSDRHFKSQNCLRLRFPVEEKKPFSMSVELLDKVIRVELCGESFDLPVPNLADEVYIGFTACEGINRFYEAEITE